MNAKQVVMVELGLIDAYLMHVKSSPNGISRDFMSWVDDMGFHKSVCLVNEMQR